MDWTPGGVSSDIEDRRDSSGGGGFGFGNGGGGGLGILGFVIVLIISLVTGHNFLGGLFNGGSQGGDTTSQSQYGPSGSQYGPQTSSDSRSYGASNQSAQDRGEDRDVHLISFILDDAQATWTRIFQSMGKDYRHAKLVLYRGTTYSGCGTARAQTGPFYCPADQKIYIDLGFWSQLRQFGGDTGDFAQAYVITHELGHHIQNLLGIMNTEQHLIQQNPSDRNQYSVDLELQADCFSGVWAHSAVARGFVHPPDVAAALRAAAAVGDDHLQQMAGRAVSPENFTHGTSAQREHWFRSGLNGGAIANCNTFGAHAGAGEW